MSFDLAALRAAVAAHGTVARVVVAGVQGSAPREAGVAMLIWRDAQGRAGQAGTIGGGALEHQAADAALEVLEQRGRRLDRRALGPDLGQCCGGAVTLLTELWDAARLAALGDAAVVARPAGAGAAAQPPLAVRRLVNRARSQGGLIAPGMVQGWMVEPVSRPRRAIWVWGAGHVGRAIVAVLAPLPDLAITWVDVAPARFPDPVPDAVCPRMAANPADLVPLAPTAAEHLIVTYSHALDLELCHRLLRHGAQSIGLIGSASKRARFRSRLRTLGHLDAQIDAIACPIGDPALGKHPQAIALGVGAALLRQNRAVSAAEESAG